MENSVVWILFLGFGLGLKHAIEADHLAAVSTIVAERRSLLSSALVGGFWGVGHTLTLVAIGIVVIFFKLTISEKLEGILEGFVGIMLVILGANALRKLFKKDQVHIHAHEHEGNSHVHVHGHEKSRKSISHHILATSPRSMVIGMVHGIAGSAALMLLILPTISSPALAFFYIIIFGVGSIAGMMLMSVVIGFPIYFTAGRFSALNKILLACAGLFSFALGLTIIYKKLIA